VPVLDDAGHMTPQDVERELNVDVALRWGNGYDTEVRSFVNVIATGKGGTHVTGFERALTKTFNDVVRNTRGLMKAGEADLETLRKAVAENPRSRAAHRPRRDCLCRRKTAAPAQPPRRSPDCVAGARVRRSSTDREGRLRARPPGARRSQ